MTFVSRVFEALMGQSDPHGTQAKSDRMVLRLLWLGVLLFIWGILLYQLDRMPPGLQHDQTFNIFDAIQVLHGQHQIYFTSNFGKEGLFIYTIAGVYKLLGLHWIWGLRFSSVLWGTLGLAATIALACRYLGQRPVILAATLMGGSFWLIFTARVGLRAISAMALLTIAIYLLVRGLERQSWGTLALAGLPAGLAMYTYLSARAFLALVPMLIIYELLKLLWRRGKSHPSSVSIPNGSAAQPYSARSRAVLIGLLLSWLLTVGLSSPLFWYLRTALGGLDQRLTDLGGPLLALAHGDFRPVMQTGWEALLALLWADHQGVPYHYNVPGRPVLPLYWAVFFLLGLALTLRNSLRQSREFLLSAALVCGLAPALLSPGGPFYLRAIAAMPLVFLLTARGVWSTAAAVLARSQLHAMRATGAIGFFALIAALVGWHLYDNVMAYFTTWGNAAATQQIYNADLRAAASYLNSVPPEQPVYISTDFWLDLDQQTYLLYAPRRKDVAWFYGPEGFPLPGDRGGLYMWTPSAPNNSLLAETFAQADYPQYVVNGPQGCCAGLISMNLTQEAAERAVQRLNLAPLTPPVEFAATLRLVAATAFVTRDEVKLISRWTVTSGWTRSAPPKIAAVLADEYGYIWSQSDKKMAVAYQQWQVGADFLQLTTIGLPADIPPGTYNVLVRIYDETAGNLTVQRAENILASDPVAATVSIGITRRADPAPMPPYVLPRPTEPAPLQLLGSWERLGELLVGVPTNIHISWRATEQLETTALRFWLEAIDQDGGQRLWSQDVTPATPLYPTWPAGQIWRLTHRLLPQGLDAGAYQASLRLCALQNTDILGCAVVATAQVTSRPILWSEPWQPEYISDAQWGDFVRLVGYNLKIAEDTLALTLLWRTNLAPPYTLVRFVHLVDDQDQIIAQADTIPGAGRVDMSLWQPGEYVVDQVVLRLPEGSAPPRRLYLGLYDPSTGKRVPVWTRDGVEQANQRLALEIKDTD